MAFLKSALNWYHKKIGAYDKELWEKSVDRRILRGLHAVPRKSTRIKTELIDVDLVRGSAFAKAKPQHSSISATVAGVKHVLLMPFFFSWWKMQTNSLVSGVLVFLYILQIAALAFYFCADCKDFSEIPIFEILTPAAMMLTLGIILSQVIATFSSKKRGKHLAKRRRFKSKLSKDSVSCNLRSKSSAESDSDCGSNQYLPASETYQNMQGCSCMKISKKDRSPYFELAEKLKSESASEESGVIDINSSNSRLDAIPYFYVNGRLNFVKRKSRSSNISRKCYSDEGPVERKQDDYIIYPPFRNYWLSADDILTPSSAVVKQYDNESVLTNQTGIRCNCSLGPSGKRKKTGKLTMQFGNNISSCESCADTTSPNTPSQPQSTDFEWPLINNTDSNSDSSDTPLNCCNGSSSDISPYENPFAWEIQKPSKKLKNVGCIRLDKVSCTIWQHGECKKADLTALDISSAIIHRVDSSEHSSEYLYIGVFCSLLLSLLPLLFRLRNGLSVSDIQVVSADILTLNLPTYDDILKIADSLLGMIFGPNMGMKFMVFVSMLERFVLSLGCFFLLSVAEKSFTQRYLHAKHFCYLTSSRKAKRSKLPHFRLNKVKNIKVWLSIRSYLKKLGPQRSVDVIVTIAFIVEVCIVSLLCILFLREEGQFTNKYCCWELTFWTMTLGLYLLRFMVLGTKINEKYRNLSVLITEQINLYLHMEQKPHKKEGLTLTNNVLKLAVDLLKELESPFKISGLCANSYLYNITKVIVLSAFSAMLTDVLGFKLKLYKIKIK